MAHVETTTLQGTLLTEGEQIRPVRPTSTPEGPVALKEVSSKSPSGQNPSANTPGTPRDSRGVASGESYEDTNVPRERHDTSV